MKLIFPFNMWFEVSRISKNLYISSLQDGKVKKSLLKKSLISVTHNQYNRDFVTFPSCVGNSLPKKTQESILVQHRT